MIHNAKLDCIEGFCPSQFGNEFLVDRHVKIISENGQLVFSSRSLDKKYKNTLAWRVVVDDKIRTI